MAAVSAALPVASAPTRRPRSDHHDLAARPTWPPGYDVHQLLAAARERVDDRAEAARGEAVSHDVRLRAIAEQMPARRSGVALTIWPIVSMATLPWNSTSAASVCGRPCGRSCSENIATITGEQCRKEGGAVEPRLDHGECITRTT